MASFLGQDRRQPTSPPNSGGNSTAASVNSATYESIGQSDSVSSLSAPYNFFSALHRARRTTTTTTTTNTNRGRSRRARSARGSSSSRPLRDDDGDDRTDDGDTDGNGQVWRDDGGDGLIVWNTACWGMEGTISCDGLGRGLVLGLVLWAILASVVAVSLSWLASSRELTASGDLSAYEHHHQQQDQKSTGSSSMEVAAIVGPNPKSWCLPGAVHQKFSGLILTGRDDGVQERNWEGDHWWYHDAITTCFHILASVGEEVYGFWEAGIINMSGTTDYFTAAYRGGECLYYQEEMVAGEPFEDVKCRGSAWIGNATFEENVEYGYGTKGERWGGRIPDGHNSGDWGLPPGTESLIDFVRNPENEDEVRLLYHKVIAPAKGVLGWAGGESLAFDLVFTGAETLSAVDVQALVKVPKECEVMAGEFHDQQARHQHPEGPGRRAQRRSLSQESQKTKLGAPRTVARRGELPPDRKSVGESQGAGELERPVKARKAARAREEASGGGAGHATLPSPVHRLLGSLSPRRQRALNRR